MKKHKKIILILTICLIVLGGCGIFLVKNINDFKNEVITHIRNREIKNATKLLKNTNEYVINFVKNDIINEYNYAIEDDYINMDSYNMPAFLEIKYPDYFKNANEFSLLGKELGLNNTNKAYMVVTKLMSWKSDFKSNVDVLIYQNVYSNDKLTDYITRLITIIPSGNFSLSKALMNEYYNEFISIREKLRGEYFVYFINSNFLDYYADFYNNIIDYHNAAVYNDISAFESAKSKIHDNITNIMDSLEDAINCQENWINIVSK